MTIPHCATHLAWKYEARDVNFEFASSKDELEALEHIEKPVTYAGEHEAAGSHNSGRRPKGAVLGFEKGLTKADFRVHNASEIQGGLDRITLKPGEVYVEDNFFTPEEMAQLRTVQQRVGLQ